MRSSIEQISRTKPCRWFWFAMFLAGCQPSKAVIELGEAGLDTSTVWDTDTDAPDTDTDAPDTDTDTDTPDTDTDTPDTDTDTPDTDTNASVDADGDGFVESEDCDDTNPSIHPDADEVCDGVDNDCDEAVDDNDDNVTDPAEWYADTDDDGFPDKDAMITACDAPSGFITEDDWDCDDDNEDIHPDADEVCDEVDNNCNGWIDDDDPDISDSTVWYIDYDGDGYGSDSISTESCTQPDHFVEDASDCDDLDDEVFPGALEVCDDIDNDCDDAIDDEDDDAADPTDWYDDNDGDGFPDEEVTVSLCEAPSGFMVEAEWDCDDDDKDVNPDAIEICDKIDNDCDGAIDDEDDDVTETTVWYLDADGDGFADEEIATDTCDAPSDYIYVEESADTGDDWATWDCDDDDAAINPDAEETCDGVDTNCDGELMTGGDDADGDGINNCEDPTVYTTDWSSGWGEWTTVDLGGSNEPAWEVTSAGYLYEGSNAALSFAASEDLGELETYTITVDVWNSASANNDSGIVFAFDGTDTDGDYFMALWSDPTNYYGTGASMALTSCSGGLCTTLDTDDGSVTLYTEAEEWITLSVVVDGDDIVATWDGYEILSATVTGGAPIGMDHVGLYTYDNDGGVYYSDLVITNP